PKVISRFHNTILVIVGDGSMRDELSSLSRKLGISRNVVFTGELPDPSPILSILDVFVLPSLTEALGIAILEAMAFSLPVIASNVGGIPEAIDNDRTGILVPPGNPAALGEALIRFAGNPRMRESYGSAGRERFLKLFTDSAMADQTLEVYKRVLAKSQGW
ncbi:MAG: glycosyltransferase family 4 protein, partial [Bacillota bacterium]